MNQSKRKRALGTHAIARICHVTPPAVIRWITNGMLPSFTTGGGHRRVWSDDLVVFMRDHNIPVPGELDPRPAARVLVVDDEPGNRKLIERVVRRSHPEAEVQAAEDGFEAAHKLHAWVPSVVVLDLRLPGIDGLKVCRMIRGDGELRRVRVLAISGFDVEESRTKALDAGADDFLGKPFDVDELSARLARLLAGGGGWRSDGR